VIRRLLQDHDEFRGEVIFTFDGDAAGQKAALRAFEGDQIFAGQTYVAVEPSGMDPCDLRLSVPDRAEGDAAVRELVARRVPLYRFVLANVVQRYDLDRADGRIDALREAAKLVTSIRDRSKVDAFSRELAGMLGIEPVDVQREVRRAAARGSAPSDASHAGHRPHAELPDPRDSRLFLERETLKIVLQHPDVVGRSTHDVGPEDFTHGAYRALWTSIEQAGGPAGADAHWAARLRDAQTDERLQELLSSLAVEPLRREPDAAYAQMHADRLRELTAKRRIADIKSRLQRTNPVENPTDYNRMFGELVALEAHARTLRERALESQQ
jgi:DNA primase